MEIISSLIKVLIYVRVSTEEQMDKGYSTTSQTEECKKKAFELGYKDEEIEVISDGISGGELDRPGLNRLRDIVASDQKPELVVMFDPDRFARNLTYQLIVTDEIVKKGINLEFVLFEWKNNPEGRMYYQLRGMFAEYEREKIRERTIRGRLTKIKTKQKLSNDPRLYGYKFDTEEDVLEVHPEESKVVKLIFQLAASGKSGEEIARILANDRIPAPRGENWYGSTVTRIINNESYLGTYWAYKVDYHQGYRRERPKEEQFPIPIDPLIDHHTFEKAKQTLAKNRTNIGRPSKREYLISGLGRCHCGRTVNASVKSGNREYTYYSCVYKHKKGYNSLSGEESIQCKSGYWNSSVVDEVVWSTVKRVIENPQELIEEYLKNKEENAEKEDELSIEYDILKGKISDLSTKKNKLIDLFLSDGIDRQSYDKKLKVLEQDLKNNQNRVNEIESEIQTHEMSENEIKEQIDVLKAYQSALNDISFEQKKRIVNLLVKNVVFGVDRQITIIFNIGDFNWGKSCDSEAYGRPSQRLYPYPCWISCRNG